MPTYNALATAWSNVSLAGSSSAWSIFGVQRRTAPLAPGAYSDYILFNGFGFAVPVGEVVVGISCQLDASQVISNPPFDNVFATDREVYLNVSGPVGTNHLSLAHYDVSPRTYGNAADDWSAGLAPADVNLSSFGLLIAVESVGVPSSVVRAVIDSTSVSMTIYTELPSPISGQGGPHPRRIPPFRNFHGR